MLILASVGMVSPTFFTYAQASSLLRYITVLLLSGNTYCMQWLDVCFVYFIKTSTTLCYNFSTDIGVLFQWQWKWNGSTYWDHSMPCSRSNRMENAVAMIITANKGDKWVICNIGLRAFSVEYLPVCDYIQVVCGSFNTKDDQHCALNRRH